MDPDNLTPKERDEENQRKFDEYMRKRDGVSEDAEIILLNDDVNSFEFVSKCLIHYCKHEKLQAHQCALLVHNNGKCSVKVGKLSYLRPICVSLASEGLSVELI